MGFGIKIMPGVRVRASSRGVRVGVGPRYARAHVGTRGAGVSVGPRVARGYVGTRGSFVSSRVGPIQVGTGGVSVRAGGGPASVWLGGGGATAVVGGGPFWLSLPVRKGKQSSSYSAQRDRSFQSLYGSSNVRPNSGAAYDDYREQLERAGVKRRNRVELKAAYVHSHMLDMLPLVLVAKSYPCPHLPVVPPLPSPKEYRIAAKAKLLNQGEPVNGWLPRKRKLVAAEMETLREETERRRVEAVAETTRAYELFIDLDPVMNMLVLQAAFADNGGTAAPIAIEGTTLSVLMSFPDPAESVWPEKALVADGGGMSVKKRTKTEINEIALRHMQMHMISTAKEAFGVQPKLERVQMVAIRESESTRLGDKKVLAAASFSADDITSAFPVVSDGVESAWDSLVLAEQGQAGDNQPSLGTALIAWRKIERSLIDTARSAMLRLAPLIQVGKVSKTSRITPIGPLSKVVEGVDFEALDPDDERAENPVGSIADNPEALRFPEFWQESLAASDEMRTTGVEAAGGVAARVRSDSRESAPVNVNDSSLAYGESPIGSNTLPARQVEDQIAQIDSEDRQFEEDYQHFEEEYREIERKYRETKERDRAAYAERMNVLRLSEQAQECVREADLVGAESTIRQAVLGAIRSEAESRKRLPFGWETIESTLQWLVALRGPDAAARIRTEAEADAMVARSIDSALQQGIEERRVVQSVLQVVDENPGILQTDLYSQIDEEPSEIQRICWYLDNIGDVDRVRSGRTYALTIPSSETASDSE